MLLASLALVFTPALCQEQQASRAVVLHEVSTHDSVTSTSREASGDDRPMLGVHLAEDTEGAVIQAVVEGSPAATAGLEAGDRILKIGKKKVKSSESLIEAISKHEPGDQVTIRVMRGEERVNLKATLAPSGEVLTEEEGIQVHFEILAEAGEDGNFTLRGLKPGDYLLDDDHDDEVELEVPESCLRGGACMGCHTAPPAMIRDRANRVRARARDLFPGRDEEEEHGHEDVGYWESEDGSHRRIEIRSSGERISPDQIQGLLREYGVDIDLQDGEMQSGEVEIEVHVESDEDGPFNGDRLREVFRRLEGEDLRGGGDERGERRGGREGEHRVQDQRDRWSRDGERGGGRAERGRRWGDRGGQRVNRGGRGWNRGQGGRARGRQRGQGRGGDRMDERNDREQRGGWGEDRMRGRDDRDRMREGRQRDDRDRDRMREGRQRDDRDERWMREDERRDGRNEGRMREHEQGQVRDRERPQGLREQRAREVRDERPTRDRMRDAGPSDRREEDSGHPEMDIHERIQHLEEERHRHQEELHQHGEEMMRGFEDAFQEMDEQSSEHIRNIHEERERVIGELNQRIEEVTQQFEDALHEVEHGVEERSRGLEEERERRFEELRQREEEMGHRYEERIRELEEHDEREHD